MSHSTVLNPLTKKCDRWIGKVTYRGGWNSDKQAYCLHRFHEIRDGNNTPAQNEVTEAVVVHCQGNRRHRYNDSSITDLLQASVEWKYH